MPLGTSGLPALFWGSKGLDSLTISNGSMAIIGIPQSDAHVTQTALTKAGEAPHHTELEGEFGMVDFVVTPPYVIPIAIALAVLAVATFKAPEKTPDFYG